MPLLTPHVANWEKIEADCWVLVGGGVEDGGAGSIMVERKNAICF